MHPENHQLLHVASRTAFEISSCEPNATLVDLLAGIVDLADDTLVALINKKEVGKDDLDRARVVLDIARKVQHAAPADCEHMDTLSEKADLLFGRINRIELARKAL
jgi:hypothetical protein